MSKLILLRHLESQWNFENRFNGWVDTPLSKRGIEAAKEVASKLSEVPIDVVYTSQLVRNIDTVLRVFEYLNKYPIFKHFSGKMKTWAEFEDGQAFLPVYVSEELNERYYGKLQGLNRNKVKEQYGEEKVRLWRRSYKEAPPNGESLKDVFNRTVPFYRKYIEKDLKNGKNVLIVASHNSLRSLVKYIENIKDEDIINLEILPGTIKTYEL